MALKIFGKKGDEVKVDPMESRIVALENRCSSDLTKHVTDIEGKITKLLKEQADLRGKVIACSGGASKLKTLVQRNSTIIEKQVEESIPLEIGKLQNQVSEINENLGTIKVVLSRMMVILKQVTDPNNVLSKKVLKIEDQMEVLGRIDLIHLVDKLEIIKEQLQKAQENFLPPEVSENLKALDMKLHAIEKRLEELEDQMIRPVEEVEVHSKSKFTPNKHPK